MVIVAVERGGDHVGRFEGVTAAGVAAEVAPAGVVAVVVVVVAAAGVIAVLVVVKAAAVLVVAAEVLLDGRGRRSVPSRTHR